MIDDRVDTRAPRSERASYILSLISEVRYRERWRPRPCPMRVSQGRQVATAPCTLSADQKIGDGKMRYFSVPYFLSALFSDRDDYLNSDPRSSVLRRRRSI